MFDIQHVLTPAPPNFALFRRNSTPGEQAPAIYHYINHPLQYVYVAGVVVEVNEYNPKYYSFILDDSSGETIEVTYPRPAGSIQDPAHGAVLNAVPTSKATISSAGTKKLDSEEIEMHQILAHLDVGSIVKVKGHITIFRDYRQIRLDRIRKVTGTIEESSFWTAMGEFRDSVLSKPWVLTDADITRAKVKAQERRAEQDAEEVRAKERTKRRAEIEEKTRIKLERRYRKEEAKRAEEAVKAREAGSALMKVLKERRQARRNDEIVSAASKDDDDSSRTQANPEERNVSKHDRRKGNRTNDY